MARPRVHHEERVTTAIRLPVALRDELHDAARSRDVSANYLVNRALVDFLDKLPDVEDFESAASSSAVPSSAVPSSAASSDAGLTDQP